MRSVLRVLAWVTGLAAAVVFVVALLWPVRDAGHGANCGRVLFGRQVPTASEEGGCYDDLRHTRAAAILVILVVVAPLAATSAAASVTRKALLNNS